MSDSGAGPRKTSLLIIFLVVFIDLLGFGIVLPLLPRYGDHFQAGRWELGGLMASFSAMQFLFAPIWGRVSDRVGRRPILLLGLAGSVIFYGMFGYVSSLAPDERLLGGTPLFWLFLTRIGAGIAGATIPTAQAYIADCTGLRERGKGMALIGAAFGMGFTFGPLLAVPFSPTETGAGPSSLPGYIASGLSAMALAAAVCLLPESLRPDSQPVGRGWLNTSALRSALFRPAIPQLLLMIFLTTFAFAQFESTLSLLTQSLGMSQQDNYYAFAYLGLILTLAQGLLVRRLLPSLGERRSAIGGALLMALGLFCVAWTAQMPDRDASAGGPVTGLTALFLVLPICVVGSAFVTPALQSLLSLNTPESEQGGTLGLGQSMSALARIAGPLAGVAAFKSDARYPYWSAATFLMIGLAVLLVSRTQPPAIDPEPSV